MKAVLATHFEAGRDEGAAARVDGIERGLRELGHEVERVVLEPDARLRNRGWRPWWYFRSSPEWRARLAERAHSADLLIASYLPVAFEARNVAQELPDRVITIYDAHNDEERLASQVHRRVRRGMATLEGSTIPAYDAVWVPGSVDVETLSRRFPDARVIDVPNGVSEELPVIDSGPAAVSGAFTYGSWAYAPNRRGLHTLAGASGAATGSMHVFGSAPPRLRSHVLRRARRRQPAVRWLFHGFERSFARMPAIASGPMIVPVWHGAGTKVRTVEMAAMGVPVYTTPEAVAGLPRWLCDELPCEPRPERLLERAFASDPRDWAAARELAERVRESLAWTRLVDAGLSRTLGS